MENSQDRHCNCGYYAFLLVLKYREGYRCIGIMVLFCCPDSSLVPVFKALCAIRWFPVSADKAKGKRKVCYLCCRDTPGA